VRAVTLVLAANVPESSLGWAANPWVVYKLRTTLRTGGDTASNFIMGDAGTLVGYPVATTTQLEGGTGSPNLGQAIFGNWSQVMTLVWGDGVDLLVNPLESVAYSKGNVLLRAMVDVDVVVRHAQAFTFVTNITI
jgi:HK97 family phage major capsid protein